MLVHDMASTWDDMFVYSGKYADYALSMYRQWTSQRTSNGDTGVNLFTMLYDQGIYTSNASHESNTIHYPLKGEIYNVNTDDDVTSAYALDNTPCTPLLTHVLTKQPVKSHTI